MKITKKAHLKHKGTLFTILEKAAAVLEKWTRFFRLAAVLYVFRSNNDQNCALNVLTEIRKIFFECNYRLAAVLYVFRSNND